jgi:hypothetical protein
LAWWAIKLLYEEKKRDDPEHDRRSQRMIAAAFLPSWAMFSLLMGGPRAKSKLAGLSLNQEASQKELEGV